MSIWTWRHSLSALDIDGGYAANSKANTSLKLISRELASITILHILKYQCRLTNTNELCVGPDVTSICRMLYICIYVFDIERGPGPLAPGYGHRVHIHVSITNTVVMAILMISSSRGGHIGFFLIEKGPSPTSTFGYADGHRVQIYVSYHKYIYIYTEGVISILMF